VQQDHPGNEKRKLTYAASVLTGMGLAEMKNDELGGYVFTGHRRVYEEMQRSQFELHKEEFDLKDFELTLERVAFKEEHCYPIEPPTFPQDMLAGEDVGPLPEHLANDPEILRSIRNRGKFCQCGFTKENTTGMVIERDGHKSHVRQTVVVGGKRKQRCKKCDACLAKPCKKCNTCLNPKLKKPCLLRVCKYPVVPDCPCFA
jgi:hypothetical protein